MLSSLTCCCVFSRFSRSNSALRVASTRFWRFSSCLRAFPRTSYQKGRFEEPRFQQMFNKAEILGKNVIEFQRMFLRFLYITSFLAWVF